MESKYVIGDIKDGLFNEERVAIVFPMTLNHDTIANRLKMTNLHSAGFVRIYSEGGKTVVYCWGGSYTLGIETKDGDDKLIAETLSIR